MLSHITEALIGAGLVAPESPLSCNIAVSTGEVISLEIGSPGCGWYHVKVSRYEDLAEQFARYCLARGRFQSLTPEPLAQVNLGGWSILIARATDHKSVCAGDLAATAKSSRLAADLIDFFAVARRHSVTNSKLESHNAFIGELQAHLHASMGSDEKLPGSLAGIDHSVHAGIPYIPQHGDFALNNLGSTRGRLVIFDWEDYGTTGLAGFDIFLISLSVAGMNAESARMIRQTPDPSGYPWSFAQPACAASGLAYETFTAAVPLYLLAFSYLKRNYGLAIRKRIDGILSQILL